jgi:hypothetical protein
MVSGQPTPNLTPVLDERTRPEQVVMLVSPDMRQRAEWLGDVIKSYGVMVVRKEIRDAWNIEMITDDMLQIFAELDDNSGLNVTGGTKLMAIVAYEAFRSEERPIFYVHPEHDRLLWLYPKMEPVDLQNRIRIENFLRVHGGKITRRVDRGSVPSEWKQTTHAIINEIERLGSALGEVNRLADSAKKTMRSDPIAPKWAGSRDFRNLLELFESAGFLRIKKDRILFPSEKRRFFVNGGWLEYHVKNIVDGLRSRLPIQDIAHSLDVCHIDRCDVKNELDVVFLLENRLYIIECKTKHFASRNKNNDQKAAETLYKLDVLKDYGGLRAAGMLVSFRKLRKADQERADALGIRAVIGTAIRRLEREIEQWVRG